MNQKLSRLFVVFLFLFLIFGGGFYLYQNKGNIFGKKTVGNPISDILFLTNPVNEFTGKVDKVSGNFIWLSGKYTITPPPTPQNAPTALPGQVITVPPLPPAKVFTYKVNVTSYTIINKPVLTVIYLFNKNTPIPTPKLTINDIRVGSVLTVVTANDLRTLTSNEINAYTIKIAPIINAVTGKITNINVKDGTIVLKATPPIPATIHQPTLPAKEIEYAITVTDETEISRLGAAETPKTGATAKPPQPLKYKITDLKTDIQITVYSDSDVIETQRLKALRIEPPADFLPLSEVSPTTKPTATPKP